jgi:hypothetical protein
VLSPLCSLLSAINNTNKYIADITFTLQNYLAGMRAREDTR